MNNKMLPSLNLKKKSPNQSKKLVVVLLFLFLFSGAILTPLKPVSAQLVVTDIPKLVWDKVSDFAKTLWQRGGSLAFQQTLRAALNKVAYDTASWVGSGGEGQKPLFVTQGWGDYMAQIGDEAAGQFLESFTSNLSQSNSPAQCQREYDMCIDTCNATDCYERCESKLTTCQGKVGTENFTFNVCDLPSLDAKVRIGLGLANQQRPTAPSCTATDMIKNWEDSYEKYKSFTDDQFLEKFTNIFDPSSTELGIYWQGKNLISEESQKKVDEARTTLLGKGGWLDPLKIDGKPLSLPNQSQLQSEEAFSQFSENFGLYTGDAFIDAANLFLNQLAMSAFSNLMKNIGKIPDSPSSSSSSYTIDFNTDPSLFGGEKAIQESAIKLTQADFNIKADYNILSELVVCPDKSNPGPTNCVIDNKFMQAITEKKTVIEAIEGGYLNGGWLFTFDNQPGSHESSYNWRNISILRKYRIVPASWESAIEKIKLFYDLSISEPANYQEKKATLMDLVSCFDPYDEYVQFSSGFDAYDQAWCTGLVDPYWVLKAPFNYCKKEGVGAQIINKFIIPSQPAYGSNPYTPSSISVSRADAYCADQQTCIQENSGGGCEAYGYCNEEKRVWSFASEFCEPIDNTCQAFTKSSTGQKVAYLQNTLNYQNCTIDNAGCRAYASLGTYNQNTSQVDWSSAGVNYFNKKLSDCTAKDEGCSEFIRVKPAWGANLVMNSDFSNDTLGASSMANYLNDWPIYSTSPNKVSSIVDSSVDPGRNSGLALKLSASGAGEIMVSVYSDENNSLLPSDLVILEGQAYTVSADIYLSEGSRAAIALGSGTTRKTYETTISKVWQHVSVTRTADSTFLVPNFSIAGYGTGGSVVLYIKNIKFEMSNWDTGYVKYGSAKIYQKALPNYLESACYIGNTANGYSYELKPDAPNICFNFARRCNQSEVGCSLFSSDINNFDVPAKVANSDYCQNDCVGYDVYISKETHFNSPQAENLIPQTAQICSAQAAGCNEFTNLDDLGMGGESREYYSTLKHCVKPGQATCGNFYAWEGTVNGYQLRLYTLQKGNDGGPVAISDDSALCNATIFNAPVTSPLYNPDCQEFYDASGQTYYHLNSLVVTCSNDCRAYRMTEKNYDNSLLNAADCSGESRHWDTQENACISCINGGTWSDTHDSCVYQGIPGEGKTCSAEQNGCREYNGNSGNNVRLVSAFNFEQASPSWSSNCINGISIKPISSNRDGHSLFYNSTAPGCSTVGIENMVIEDLTTKVDKNNPLIKQIVAGDNQAAQLKVGLSVNRDKGYVVKFWANAPTDTSVKISFYNKDSGERSWFNNGNPIKISGGGTWNVYSANLDNLDHLVTENEMLIITADKSFYLDNFLLTEVINRYYLLKNSSYIPNVCYYDMEDVYRGADYNLGCKSYVDQNGLNHNLRSFSKICDQSSVGCEQVISTQNYEPYQEGIWGDLNNNGICDTKTAEPDCFTVEGDKSEYLIYDSSKLCNQSNLGCSRLGESQTSTGNYVWSDVFKKNNPNLYTQTICSADSVGCEAWQNSESGEISYFRDPGNDVCVYRTSQDLPSGQKNWYQAPVKRCDLNANNLIDSNESLLGVCLNNSNCASGSCIIDNNDYPCPVSYLETIGYGGAGSAIPVPSQSVGLCNIKASGCTEYIDPVSKFSPDLATAPPNTTFSIKPNKLYLFTNTNIDNKNEVVKLIFSSPVAPLLANNTFGANTTELQIGGSIKALIFNSLSNNKVSSISDPLIFEVKEVAIAYQIESEVDKQSCNGVTNFNNGCILFNERSIAGASGYADLSKSFDPYNSINLSAPQKCNPSVPGSCAANQIIKARPDRVCASWLDCLTYTYDELTGEKICYSLGQCNSLNDAGECNNFLASDYKPDLANATGYYFLNKYNLSAMKEQGLNSQAHYDFEELVPSLTCTTQSGAPCILSNTIKELIVREPEKSKVDYPVSGKSYLRVPANFNISPMADGAWINLAPNQNYYLSYYLNTQNAGSNAQVIVIKKDQQTGTSFYSSSDAGWSKIVHEFNSGTGVDNSVQIRIILRAENQEMSGDLYFDNINIEPVLKMGDGIYATRDCRLYPASDSLSCQNYSSSAIKNGLEGYCLEYDRSNPKVCLTWYPVDRISSSFLGTQSSGYMGLNNLSYCSNINVDIDFVKKVSIKEVYYNKDENGPGVIDANSNLCAILGSGSITDDRACEYHCGNCNYYKAVVVNRKDNHNYEQVFCVPNDESSLFKLPVGNLKRASMLNTGVSGAISCQNIGYYEAAWMEYDGKLLQVPVNLCDDNHACEYIDEINNADPPIRIYDNNLPPAEEEGLKYLAAVSGDQSKVFKFTCSNFLQTVSGSGDNKAWVVRTGSGADENWNFNTPSFFSSTLPNGTIINNYGRQRLALPYGAATLPVDFDLLNSGPIYLQNQYYVKNKDTIFGGRPYGCTGSACDKVGYCSDNPNVICAYSSFSTDTYINSRTCSDGGFGVCMPLWQLPSAEGLNFSGLLLPEIFRQSYGSYQYQSGAYIPNSSGSYSIVGLRNAPEITNVKLTLNNASVGFNVQRAGVYAIKFNTRVDPEQQPLKMIYIDWGDGNTQAFTGLEHRPNNNDPHVFYHYYSAPLNNVKIRVRAWDNWDNNKTWSVN